MLDKPGKKRPSIGQLTSIAMVNTDGGIDHDWICDLINELRVNAGLESPSRKSTPIQSWISGECDVIDGRVPGGPGGRPIKERKKFRNRVADVASGNNPPARAAQNLEGEEFWVSVRAGMRSMWFPGVFVIWGVFPVLG